MFKDKRLIGFCLLTLFVLVILADWIVPYERDFVTKGTVIEGCEISYVYDGDTLELSCPGGPRRARLVGFDTPETKGAGCVAEKALGDRATVRLRALVEGAVIGMAYQGQGKYGRDLVILRADGRDVAERLIEEGLAVAYLGAKRIDWCAKLSG